MMDAKKYAWKILHAHLRDDLAADEGQEGYSPQIIDTIAYNLAHIELDNVDKDDVINLVAVLGVQFAMTLRSHPNEDGLHLAKLIEEFDHGGTRRQVVARHNRIARSRTERPTPSHRGWAVRAPTGLSAQIPPFETGLSDLHSSKYRRVSPPR